MTTERGLFWFRYIGPKDEWFWECEPPRDQAFVQAAAQAEWVRLDDWPVEAGKEGGEFETFDALRAFTRDCFAWNESPEEVWRYPFEKLTALIAAGGWRFVGGQFTEDTEIFVVLER